ncbi:MAG: Ig-like domain-containing protein [Prevotellaceae bacterium]|jgi:hypothetical protein|nr:Ig-like domain-containing protein [Prevotellaceae bacterium]
MKVKKISLIATAIAAVMFVSCGPEPKSDASISLDKTSIELSVGGSVKLTATVTPAGATVTWSVENSAIAMVTNGTVVGKAEGTTKVIATNGDAKAECAVTVKPGGPGIDYSTIACLQGNNYFPIVLGQGAIDYLNSRGKTVTWIGANGSGEDADGDGKTDNSQNLWYWEGSIVNGTPMSTNSFGSMDGYLCISQTGEGYGGCGFAIGKPEETTQEVVPINMSDIYAHPDQYFFHVALAQPDGGQFSISLRFEDGMQNGKKTATFTFGNKVGVDNQQPRVDIPRDGNWHEFEIPCTEFVVGDQMMYQLPFYASSVMEMFLLNPNAGATAHIDAAFFYKK